MDEDKKEIEAIHESDLEDALKKIGLWDKLVAGDLQCKFCHSKITTENLHSILPESGAFNVICDAPECVTKLLQYLAEKSKNNVNE